MYPSVVKSLRFYFSHYILNVGLRHLVMFCHNLAAQLLHSEIAYICTVCSTLMPDMVIIISE